MKTTTAVKPQRMGAQSGQSQFTTMVHDSSAVGAHMDDEVAIAAMAYKLDQKEGTSGTKRSEHWERARKEFEQQQLQQSAAPASRSAPRPSRATEAFDREVEEAMHLAR